MVNNNSPPEDIPPTLSNQSQQSLSKLKSGWVNNKSAPENPPATPRYQRTKAIYDSQFKQKTIYMNDSLDNQLHYMNDSLGNQSKQYLSELESGWVNNKSAPENPPATPRYQRIEAIYDSQDS
ncbi:hypothetical protein [Okeania sp. SIO2B3]|uniref:hypothetical protein n=1 Tax=Okeania sp. SIO2B3 TaxID=2607784 RepID=UPI0013BFC8DB|nr:hypothetical protein [Okeania sp. SIO2B3]NET45475.1 hypothetical protein [Okeania sp. SIO2B3]